MSVTYYFYMDDSGARHPDRGAKKWMNNRDCFALGGILIKEIDRSTLRQSYSAFCTKWNIDYPLHSEEIRNKRGYFSWIGKTEDTAANFYTELSELLCNLPVLGFATVINRPAYYQRYSEVYKKDIWLMSKTAYSILIERVAKHVLKENGKLKIRFEATGKKEDKDIIEYAKSLKDSGNIFDHVRSSKYKSLNHNHYKEVILGNPERRSKSSIELQIADLFLYPMVKSAYDKSYRPYQLLLNSGRLVDSHLSEEDRTELGIKYFCF